MGPSATGSFCRDRAGLLSAVLIAVLVCAVVLVWPSCARAAITPQFLESKLVAGQSMEETKSVTVNVDVLFAFDVTDSMAGDIAQVRNNAVAIMTAIQNGAPGTNVAYGVESFGDYPIYDQSTSPPAYVFGIDQAITTNVSSVQTAISNLNSCAGADEPEAYTRAMWESYTNPGIQWRAGSRRLVVMLGDSVPHDDDINADVPGVTGFNDTLVDPGPDGIVGTPDDLDLQTVLAAMNVNNITLVEGHPPTADHAGAPVLSTYWSYWTSLTGGNDFTYSTATLPTDLAANTDNAIAQLYTITGLHLQVQPPYQSWLTNVVPLGYSGPMNGPVQFVPTISVPTTCAPGFYSLTVEALDASGTVCGTQTLNVTVPTQTGGGVWPWILTRIGSAVQLGRLGIVRWPTGATPADTEVTCTVAQLAVPLPAADGGVVRETAVMQPGGLVFDQPITVSLACPAGVSNPRAYYYDPAAREWTAIPSSVQNGYVVFNVSHFSTYGIGGNPVATSTPADSPWSLTILALAGMGFLGLSLRGRVRTAGERQG